MKYSKAKWIMYYWNLKGYKPNINVTKNFD